MLTILAFENGLRAEAVLLAAGADRLRLILKGSTDTTEVHLVKNRWISDEGNVVDIESIISAGHWAAVTRPHARVNAA